MTASSQNPSMMPSPEDRAIPVAHGFFARLSGEALRTLERRVARQDGEIERLRLRLEEQDETLERMRLHLVAMEQRVRTEADEVARIGAALFERLEFGRELDREGRS